ncbi:MAG: replicative DNA helicase [Acidimicrobiia bacterium]
MYEPNEPPPDEPPAGGGRARGLRVPPHNREAEQSVLGALLLSADAVNLVMDRLGGEDFYVPAHQSVYEAIAHLYAHNQPIDAITVADHLRKHGELDRVGGIAFLSDLSEMVPTAANIEYYASIVSEQAVRRRLLEAGATIGQLATTTDQEIDWVIDEAEQAVFRVAEGKVGDGLTSIGQHMDATIARIEELESTAGHVTGLPTGFRDLDEKLSGLQKANLIVVAARPGMGKSVLSINVARNVALRGATVAVFSLEMSKDEIIQRLLCSTGRIDNTRLRSGNLGADLWPRVLDAADKLFKAPVFIDESSYLTVTDVRAKCRRLQRKHGLDLVIVDYLQLMQGRSRENRQQEIAEISRGLKNLARELDVPIIAVSQLNRSLEARMDKRPQLGDLRESGAIEQDSDIVMFIYRDEYYNPESEDRGIAEVAIAKHRAGATGRVFMSFAPAFASFGDLAREPRV